MDRTESKIKVLMIVANLRPSNGVASFAMNYYRALDPNVVTVDFALYEDRETPYYKDIYEKGGRIFILPPINQYKKHIAECRSILAEGKYDIIHDNSLLITLPLMREAKKAGIPVRILHSHATKMGETKIREFRNSLFLPLLIKEANTYFACSNMAGQAMFKNHPFVFVPNVIPAEEFKYDHNVRKAVREKMGVSDEDYVIATVGRVAYQKNPFFAVDVMAEYMRNHSNVRYWWIGSGPLQDELEAYVRKYGLEESIVFFGSRTDVRDLYQAMDMFFLPSIYEGLPLTGIEAQAMGLPMVVSDSITDEMVYTDLVHAVALSSPVEEWVKIIIECRQSSSERSMYSKELKNSIFSSATAGDRLTGFYDRELNRER